MYWSFFLFHLYYTLSDWSAMNSLGCWKMTFPLIEECVIKRILQSAMIFPKIFSYKPQLNRKFQTDSVLINTVEFILISFQVTYRAGFKLPKVKQLAGAGLFTVKRRKIWANIRETFDKTYYMYSFKWKYMYRYI